MKYSNIWSLRGGCEAASIFWCKSSYLSHLFKREFTLSLINEEATDLFVVRLLALNVGLEVYWAHDYAKEANSHIFNELKYINKLNVDNCLIEEKLKDLFYFNKM